MIKGCAVTSEPMTERLEIGTVCGVSCVQEEISNRLEHQETPAVFVCLLVCFSPIPEGKVRVVLEGRVTVLVLLTQRSLREGQTSGLETVRPADDGNP